VVLVPDDEAVLRAPYQGLLHELVHHARRHGQLLQHPPAPLHRHGIGRRGPRSTRPRCTSPESSWWRSSTTTTAAALSQRRAGAGRGSSLRGSLRAERPLQRHRGRMRRPLPSVVTGVRVLAPESEGLVADGMETGCGLRRPRKSVRRIFINAGSNR
jgi:hypothetical protein